MMNDSIIVKFSKVEEHVSEGVEKADERIRYTMYIPSYLIN